MAGSVVHNIDGLSVSLCQLQSYTPRSNLLFAVLALRLQVAESHLKHIPQTANEHAEFKLGSLEIESIDMGNAISIPWSWKICTRADTLCPHVGSRGFRQRWC